VVRVEQALAAGEDAYRRWLTPEELERLARYRFDRHRREHLATNALGRAALSRYTGIDPAAWRFVLGSYGKPALAGPAAVAASGPLAFNLTNTEGLVACAVTTGAEVGIDAEPSEMSGDPLELAGTAFHPAEVAALRAVAPAARRALFVTLWTLKEAYVKARGLGLSLPTTRFTVTPAEDGWPQARRATISFDPVLQDDPAQWQLLRLPEIPGYELAVAVRKSAGRVTRLRVRQSPTLDVHRVP
jgi:4'-phosphopantetheinyl transferase